MYENELAKMSAKGLAVVGIVVRQWFLQELYPADRSRRSRLEREISHALSRLSLEEQRAIESLSVLTTSGIDRWKPWLDKHLAMNSADEPMLKLIEQRLARRALRGRGTIDADFLQSTYDAVERVEKTKACVLEPKTPGTAPEGVRQNAWRGAFTNWRKNFEIGQ
jgi:hypothetical protein